jgi:dihydroorotase
VHFREPGNAHKEDLESGSRAAVLGGVTGVFEMPNTNPPTTNRAAIEDKLGRAAGRMHCDYAFYVGATPANIGELAELEKMPGVCGVKAFLGSSTGTLLLSKPEDILAARKMKTGCSPARNLPSAAIPKPIRSGAMLKPPGPRPSAC